MVSFSTVHVVRALAAWGAAPRPFMVAALLAAASLLSPPARAQAAGDCQAANAQRADDLLQALSAARRKRTSLSFIVKLAPIEAQLKTLKATAQQGGSAADCQRLAAQIDTERGRLAQLVPDLPPETPPTVAAAPVAPVPAPAPAIATAPAPVTRPSLAAPGAACSADNEQARADLAQRFVLFMQMARVPPAALAPYQSFGRRLAALDAGMAARPDDCAGHAAALAQANGELQQLMAMEARTAQSAAGAAADGAIPLPSNAANETCVTDLRQGLREVHQAAAGVLMTQSDGEARAQAQQVANRAVRQQVDALARSPLSAEACEQSRQSVGEMRASVAALRSGAPQPAVRPMAPASPPPQALASPTPAPARPAQQPAAQSQPDEGNAYLECMANNRRLYGDLEREGNQLKATGRLNPAQAGAFDNDLGTFREWLRKGVLPVQCAILADSMTNYLARIRQLASRPAAPAAPVAAAAPAPAVAVTTTAPPAAAHPAAQAKPASAPTPAAAAKPAPAAAPPAAAAHPQPAVAAAPAKPAPAAKPRDPKCQDRSKLSDADKKRCAASEG